MTRTSTDRHIVDGGGLSNQGTVLIVSIWIMLVLAGVVLVMARAMRVEGGGSANQVAASEASAIEAGAVQYVIANVDGLDGRMPSAEEMPCEGVLVGDGAFWILRSQDDTDAEQGYGLVSEAAKVNLNTASAAVLAELPDMPAELAAGIVDWRDSDGDLTSGGAESEYYLLLPEPYECKNSSLETVAEVMLVAGAAEDMLFGEDANGNGVLEPNENDGDGSAPADDRDGTLDPGLYAVATVYSVEANTDASGQERVNVNDQQMQALAQLLGEKLKEDRAVEAMVLARRERPFANTLDFYVRTELKDDEFEAIADRITTHQGENVRGLIDLRAASEQVLACLPELDERDITALLASRPSIDAEPSSIAWVAAVLPAEKAVAIGSLITDRSQQFSADVVSVSGNGRAFRRCRIVVDARQSPPRVVYRQDLTGLGWPLSGEILRQLRNGTPIDKVVEGEYQEIR